MKPLYGPIINLQSDGGTVGMKEGMPIFYSNPELIDRFFTGGKIE